MKRLLIVLIQFLVLGLYSHDNFIIGKELGILEAQIETYNENIVIYNQDGSVWMQFDFNFENKLENKNQYSLEDVKKLYNWNKDFNPYAFHIDYSLLMFKCTSIEGNKYKVIVNKETGLEKYIVKEKFWVLRDLKDHIINSVVSIDFNSETNPIRQNPSEESSCLKINDEIDPAIDPIEIKDDWLRIKYWENETEKTGWIKCNCTI